MNFDVPVHLSEDILRGRCIAFVGAGFSAPVLPQWTQLLRELHKRCRVPDPEIERALDNASNAFEFETLGQLLKERLGKKFEQEVRKVLGPAKEIHKAHEAADTDDAYAHGPASVVRRRKTLLEQIPFKAILTLNVDPVLHATRDASARRWNVLRGDLRWWERADPEGALRLTPPVIKLHGDATGNDEAPVVLGRADYRKLLYEDARYASFLRAIFASHTVLFLGVSFTDAYLNELRSEILAWIEPDERPPWYAVLEDKTPLVTDYFRSHEGIEVMTWDTQSRTDWSGFDRWLEAIHARACPRQRLRRLLEDRHIVWVEPGTDRIRVGVRELRAAGAKLTIVPDAAALLPEHANADLLLTRYLHRGDDDAAAFDVMEVVREWPVRPPVVAFASGDFAHENRAAFLRRGGWEYASGWQELFRLLELLFARRHE